MEGETQFHAATVLECSRRDSPKMFAPDCGAKKEYSLAKSGDGSSVLEPYMDYTTRSNVQ